MVLAWLVGIIISLRWRFGGNLSSSLFLSLLAYYLLLFITSYVAPYHFLLPVAALLIGVSALPAGAFFRDCSTKISGYSLFLHENNGFILGYFLSLIGFVKWGITFMYWAPLVTWFCVFVCLHVGRLHAIFALAVIGVFCALYGNTMLVIGVMIALGWGMITLQIKPQGVQSAKEILHSKQKEDGKNKKLMSRPRNLAILFMAGLNLILLQYIITREFSAILAASELSILVVGIAYFTGYSVGYGVSRFMSFRVIAVAAIFTFFMHILLIVFAKFGSGYLIRAGHGLAVLLSLLFVTSFLTSTFYSILLPKIIAAQGNHTLSEAYSWDLCGAVTGVLIMILLIAFSPYLLLPLYFLFLLALVYLTVSDIRCSTFFLAAGLIVLALFTIYQEKISIYGAEDYYATRGYDNPRLLFQGNSFYHSVEVVESYKDQEQSRPKARHSFLNGVRYFDYKYNDQGNFSKRTSLSEFTYFLAELPAKYLAQKKGRRLRVLILGGGSMYSINRVKDYSFKTTLVEIDPMVIDSSIKHWSDFNQYEEVDNCEIIIDDAKHYLMTTDEIFDLIIMDISAPYYLGTMVLHNKDFFELVKKHLHKSGIFSESTQGRPYRNKPNGQGMKILAAVREVFSHYRVIDGKKKPRGRHGYVYASENFKFSTKELVSILKNDKFYKGTAIYTDKSSYYDFSKTIPFSMTNLETLFSGNKWRLEKRLRLNKKKKSGFTKGLWDYKLSAAIARKIQTPLYAGLLFLVLALTLAPIFSLFRKGQKCMEYRAKGPFV